MEFEDLFLILSLSDFSDILGFINENKIFVHQDLSLGEEQKTINQLIGACNSGYDYCIVTRHGMFVNN